MRIFLLVCLLLWVTPYLFSQNARERSVELSATVQESPPQIQLNWPSDPNATFYKVYRKNINDDSWGLPIADLPGSATTYIDTNVSIGQAYEYGFFKKEFDLVQDTFCVPPGTNLKFAISDMYGIGLCCNFNFGFYRISACDQVIAEGSDFGWYNEEYFQVCDNGQSCTEVVITIAPDIFPNSTSWVLSNDQTSEVIGSSGPAGTFIDERPKYGFIYAGIKAPALETPGKILLMIDDEYLAPLSNEIETLKQDLIAEGWIVLIRYTNKNTTVNAVKSQILEVYQSHPDLRSLFLIGHIPVPYSGNIYPDTHSENHQGAWSADTYYGELDGNWTDQSVDITTAFFPRNHNIPGDGKFDQDSIPTGKMELEVGRIDFFDMSFFQANEIELTRRYLNKNHLWRSGKIDVKRRALVDDNFNAQFAAPAASAWRNFAPMFGSENIHELDYFETMRDESYLWSYGCGSGTHISVDGVGTTQDFANDSLLTVFTMQFGSQFGDWDNDNNFLKAPLASGLTLTNVWAGNPPYNFHHMALGHTIGYSVRATQNTNGVYHPGPQLVHTALLGDPTLRMHIVKPPLSFEPEQRFNSEIKFHYSPSPDPEVMGYYIYRSTNPDGGFERISPQLLTDPSTFTDIPPYNGQFYYMLRAIKLEQSASGTYYNLSPGIIKLTDFFVSTAERPIEQSLKIFPNPTSDHLMLQLDQRYPMDIGDDLRIEIINTNGQIQKSFNHLHDNQMLDLQGLANGVYFLNIYSKKGRVWTKRFVKLSN